MQYIVDRIEEDYVVCEDDHKQMHDFKKIVLPANVKEGDVIIEQDGRFEIDFDKTEERSRYIRSLMEELWD